MRRLILLPVIITLLVAVGIVSRVAPASAGPAPAPIAAGPVCSVVCDKTGINTGWSIGAHQSEYLHAQRLGMSWIMEVAGNMGDVNKTAEAINRANAHGLRAVVRICSGNQCLLGEPELYSDFLHQVASQVDGEFWALMGPNEPDLEHWAGGASGVARFMNGTLDRVGDIPNLKTLSPAFNLTNDATPKLFRTMETSGARFADLDGFAGTSYSLGGTPAYYYYAHKGGSETYRQKVLRYRKPFIFIETGTFALTGHLRENDPLRPTVVATLRKDFGLMVNDPTVMGVLYFNAFGDNVGMRYHMLYDSELVRIARDATCRGGGYSPVGIGVSTTQKLWQAPGAPACQKFEYGCGFVGGSVCPADGCVDTDGDGLYGDGGSCTRNDCDDSDPSKGLSCGAGAADRQAGWGVLRIVETGISAPDAWPAIDLGAGDLPVIGYQSGPVYQGDLAFLRCTDPGCSAALRRVLVRDNDSGIGLSMTVRDDDRPIFAYLNRTHNYLETFSCSDPACLSGFVNVKDLYVGLDRIETSIAVLPGGKNSIAYWASGGSNLGAVTCSDPDCADGTPYLLEESGQTGLNPTIFTSQSGLPYIVYGRTGPQNVRLLRCGDAECSFKEKKFDLAAGAKSLATSAVAVRLDGTPLILYHRPGVAVSLYGCDDATCASGTATNIYPTSNPVENGSIALLQDGRPFIAFSEKVAADDYDLVLVACLDVLCASTSVDRVTAGSAGKHPDVVVRPGGDPLVVYHDVGHGRLVVYDVDIDLVPAPQETSVPTPTSTPTETPTAPTPTLTRTPGAQPVPVLRSPQKNAVIRKTPTFSWASVDGARAYQFEYASDFDFTGPVNSGDLSVTKFTPPPMPKGAYFWHVRARNAAGNWSEWSVPRVVIVALPLPSAPGLVSPLSGRKVPGGELPLTWKTLAANASRYEVWVSPVSTFSRRVFETIVSGPFPDASVSVTTVALPPRVYYWRVRALNEDGERGPWSKVWSVTVPAP